MYVRKEKLMYAHCMYEEETGCLRLDVRFLIYSYYIYIFFYLMAALQDHLLKHSPKIAYYSKMRYGCGPGNLFIIEMMTIKEQCPSMTSLRRLVYSGTQQRGNGSEQPSGPPDHLYSSTQKCSEGC